MLETLYPVSILCTKILSEGDKYVKLEDTSCEQLQQKLQETTSVRRLHLLAVEVTCREVIP